MENNFTLFVKGLHPCTSEESLTAYFEYYGKVSAVLLKRDKLKNISRCFGFVSFSSMEECRAVLDHPKHTIDKKRVTVTFAMTPTEALKSKSRKKAGNDSLVLSKIPKNVTKSDLLPFLQQFGEIDFLSELLKSTSGSKYGFLTFTDPQVSANLLHKRRLRFGNAFIDVYPQNDESISNQLKDQKDYYSYSFEDSDNTNDYLYTDHQASYNALESTSPDTNPVPYPDWFNGRRHQSEKGYRQGHAEVWNCPNPYFQPESLMRVGPNHGPWRGVLPDYEAIPGPPANIQKFPEPIQEFPIQKYESEIDQLDPSIRQGMSNVPSLVVDDYWRHTVQTEKPYQHPTWASQPGHFFQEEYFDTGIEANLWPEKEPPPRNDTRVRWLKQEISRLEDALRKTRSLLEQEEKKSPEKKEE